MTHERLPFMYRDPAQLNCAMAGTILADNFKAKEDMWPVRLRCPFFALQNNCHDCSRHQCILRGWHIPPNDSVFSLICNISKRAQSDARRDVSFHVGGCKRCVWLFH